MNANQTAAARSTANPASRPEVKKELDDLFDDPLGDSLDALREEAARYTAETGRLVEQTEEVIERPDGTRTHRLTIKLPKPGAVEAVACVLKAGARPVREEDGIVRLRIPFPEPAPGCDRRIEQVSWPIRSPETASLIMSYLFDAGLDEIAPRELKRCVMILEGQALREQEPITAQEAHDWDPVLEAVMRMMEIYPDGWRGTASGLLTHLNEICADDHVGWSQYPGWPKDARSLSVQLKRAQRWFAELGLRYSVRRHAEARMHVFYWQRGKGPLEGPASSPTLEEVVIAGGPVSPMTQNDAGSGDFSQAVSHTDQPSRSGGEGAFEFAETDVSAGDLKNDGLEIHPTEPANRRGSPETYAGGFASTLYHQPPSRVAEW